MNKSFVGFIFFLDKKPLNQIYFSKKEAIEVYTKMVLLGLDRGIKLSQVTIHRNTTFYKSKRHNDKPYFAPH